MDNISSYQVRDLEPLLQYDKPLEVLHCRWSVDQNYDPSEEFGRIIYDPDYDPDMGTNTSKHNPAWAHKICVDRGNRW